LILREERSARKEGTRRIAQLERAADDAKAEVMRETRVLEAPMNAILTPF